MLKWINKKRNKKGFTLIELVVVIAILGILAAIAVPRLSGFRDSATERADKASAATIGKAAELHAAAQNLDEDEKDGLDIEELERLELIDEDLVPQKEEYKSFFLEYSAEGVFEVYYGNDDGTGKANATDTRLYPEPSEIDDESGDQ